MKIKKYWIAIQAIHGDKYDAFIIPAYETDNIFCKLSGIAGIVSANIFDTQKAARATVCAWVAGFRAAGCYRWDTMPDGGPAPF